MMILVKFLSLSLILAIAFIGCSTKYVITDNDGQEVSVQGEISNKILFRTKNGIPVVIEPKSVVSLEINNTTPVVMNNHIFYEAMLTVEGSKEPLDGYIAANNTFNGSNKNLSFKVNFNKIKSIKKEN